MNEKQIKNQELKTKTEEKLQIFLGRLPTAQEVSNAETDVGLLVRVLKEQIVDILIRLDKNKL